MKFRNIILFKHLFICHCLFLVRSCLLITLIECMKGHKALRSLCMSKSKRLCLYVCSEVVTGVGRELSQTLVWTAKNKKLLETGI